MAVAPLLHSGAVLDLCGSDVVLPSNPPTLHEVDGRFAKGALKHTLGEDLRSRLASSDLEARVAGILAFLNSPQKAIADAQAKAASQSRQTPAVSRSADARLSFIGRSNLLEDDEADAAPQATRPKPIVGWSRTLATLTETLAVGVGLMRRWSGSTPEGDPRPPPAAAAVVADALEECFKLSQALPRPRDAKGGEGDTEADTRERFHAFLEQVVLQVRLAAERPGAILFLPCGWLRSRTSREAGALADDGGHCVLLVLARAADREEFTLAVANAGEGLEYHPVRPSGAPPSPELPVRQSPLVLAGVPAERLKGSALWYLLYRQIVYPDPSNGAGMMYGTLLPFANQQPLSANQQGLAEHLIEYLPVPTAGDRSFAACLERAVRFALLAAGMGAAEATWWSSVRIKQALVGAIGEALRVKNARRPAAAELALVRAATGALARAAAEHADRYREGGKEGRARLEEAQRLVEQTEEDARALEMGERNARSAQPPRLCAAGSPSETITAGGPAALRFGGFERVPREDVERLKGEVDPPRILIPVLSCTLPLSVNDAFEAAECCRLTAHLLTLLVNQQDQISHSVPARFALVGHLIVRMLPMPLPLNHPDKATKCFWMREMRYETKADIMRHLYLITRNFAAAAFTLRANRETDGTRVIVAAALAAVMDALMRRPLDFLCQRRGKAKKQPQGTLLSQHYSGQGGGPTRPFGLDPGVFREASETLLLVAPEYVALRTVVLDYFTSIRSAIDDSHVIFRFDETMACSEGDRTFVEQVGLCLGVDAPRRDAHLLLTGERPDLAELFLELLWFRDVVFLWKMLLAPQSAQPEAKAWRATDSVLEWHWDRGQFNVRGFGVTLSPDVKASSRRGGSAWWSAVTRWFRGAEYKSDFKALSSASASVLTGTEVRTEDDVLALQNLPSFNDTLRPAESELLLAYLTAPYLRVPLLLGFFMDRSRLSLLREPQLQVVLDAALFEPGPWRSPDDQAKGPPNQVPGPDRAHLGTPAGFLFNELLHSPRVTMEAIISMLKTAVEKDAGRPGAANEGLILYIVRLAVRVESYLLVLIKHARRDAYLEKFGANWAARVRGFPSSSDEALITRLEADYLRLRKELQTDVFQMIFSWAAQATRRRDELMSAACRAHAHMALLYKNVPPERFDVQGVAVFLSSQIFLNMNHRWFNRARDASTDPGQNDKSLGIPEFELFDMFEAKRSQLAAWLEDNPEAANEVFEKVERVVTFKGTVEGLFPGEAEGHVREWVELDNEPGNFVPKVEAPPSDWMAGRPGENFQSWLLRVTQGPVESNGQVSVNLGQYKMKREGLQLLPDWAAESEDYLEAYGRVEVQTSVKEVTSKRLWKEIVGHRHEVQRWVEDHRGPEADAHASKWLQGRPYKPKDLVPAEHWLAGVLEPVRARLPLLQSMALFVGRIGTGPSAEAWLVGVMESAPAVKDERPIRQAKEVAVWRDPPLVEVYDVLEYGRQFYRSVIFSSDTMWSFHSPPTGELLLHRAESSSWHLASGRVEPVASPAASVLVFRHVMDSLGRQMYMPSRFLRGLLPDVLLERYRFWRSESGGNMLIGDERKQWETPTRLYVMLEEGEGSVVAAVVQRRILREPQEAKHVPQSQWNEDAQRPTEVLVNIRKGASGLGVMLARLENLSHILAWTLVDSQDDAIQKVELPRLRLSFTRSGDRLMCDQHSGKWLMPGECPAAAKHLVSQWGGGTALLEDDAGELTVLVSAVAEPIRPAAHGAEVGPVERFLPSQLVLRRGESNWVSNLAEGSRHYHYPVHLSGAMAFTPTPSASLYLLLCRFLTWHFAEVSAMASAIVEASTGEERQLWERLGLLKADSHADAVACRLRIILATMPFGAAAVPPWDKGRQLLEYARKRRFVSADCALSADQELALLKLPEVMAFAQREAPELEVRRGVLQQLTSRPSLTKASLATPPSLPAAVQLGPCLDDSGFDRVWDPSFLEQVGVLDRLATSIHGVAYNRLDGEKPTLRGLAALQFLDGLFEKDGAGGLGTVKAPFLLLYELFTGTVVVEATVADSTPLLASALLRLAARTAGRGPEISVLRVLDRNPELRAEVPAWGSEATKRILKVGSMKLDRDSASRLLRAALDKLRLKEQQIRRPPQFDPMPIPAQKVMVEVQDARNPRYWSPPLTSDVLCGARGFPGRLGEEFGGQPLEAVAKGRVHLERQQGVSSTGKEAVKIALETLSRDTRAQKHAGKKTLARLLQELDQMSQAPQATLGLGPLKELAPKLDPLARELLELRERDAHEVSVAIGKAAEAANHGSASDWMRRKCGHLAKLTFSNLVALLMAEEPESSDALQEANPALREEDVELLLEDVAAALCRAVRVGHASRALRALRDLQAELHAGGTEMSVALKAQAVAELLAARRHFTRVADGPGPGEKIIRYDPRLLVFEFLFGLVLRETQVRIVGALLSRARQGRSVCHQMIMGDGKTTVIAPLLALLLADGRTLMCTCMPASLLEMSRAIMIERFSSPVAPRPVITLTFSRLSNADHALKVKLEAARRSRAVVVATPATLKSVLLKHAELLNQLDASRLWAQAAQASAAGQWFGWGRRSAAVAMPATACRLTAEEELARIQEVQVCSEVLRMFHKGVVVLDEVDLLLDPLRSELNWPMGRKRPLDLTEGGDGERAKHRQGLRNRLPFHLLDALFVATGSATVSSYADRAEAQSALAALGRQIEVGKRTLKLQAVPHIVLLSREFYMHSIMPYLADWASLFLERHVEGALGNEEVKGFLRNPRALDGEMKQRLREAPDLVVKLLNLSAEWLHHLLPHILSKVHRVSYGLLTGPFLERKSAPRSRRLLAVPFVGKDQPSDQSEFSHPDVAIGFTILAYRYSGLRWDDNLTCLRVLQSEMKMESTIKFHRRNACRTYVGMITRAGGRVRGFTEDGRWIADLKEEERWKILYEDRAAVPPSPAGLGGCGGGGGSFGSPALAAAGGGGGAGAGEEGEAPGLIFGDGARGLWPLETLDVNDHEQVGAVYEVLRGEPLAIQYYLDQYVFQPNMNTIDVNEFQLTASGQELAGRQLFGLCMGFSGTPNDLLPRAMGSCVYAAGVDGKVLAALSDVRVVSSRILEEWAPKTLLDIAANSRKADGSPMYHGLIDTGALITGMTNREAAEYLLKRGLRGFGGVVFLSQRGERLVLVRDGFKVMELAQCGLSPEQRFTFYDHVHTTGMDIKQPLDCTACLTIGKDTTLRDYAQGAYRMRGIGRGQRIQLLLTPEVVALMHKTLARVEGGSADTRAATLANMPDPEARSQRLIVDVLTWLTMNGICHEERKHRLLCQQNLRNLWRSSATAWLEAAPASSEIRSWLAGARTRNALRELRNRLDFMVSNKLPGEGEEGLLAKLRRELGEHATTEGGDGEEVQEPNYALLAEAEGVLSELEGPAAAAAASVPLEAPGGEGTTRRMTQDEEAAPRFPNSFTEDDLVEGDLELQQEQVQEQEQEQEQEEEEEEEREEEEEMEIEVEAQRAPEAAAERAYAREDEAPQPWPLAALAVGVGSGGPPFYPLAEFSVNKGVLGTACSPLQELPRYVMLSENYYRRSWRLTSVRRLKNLICFLEWVPDTSKLKRLQVKAELSQEQVDRLSEVFELFDTERSGRLGGQQLRSFFKALDLDEEGKEAAVRAGGEATWTLEEVKREIASQSFYRMQQGRYYVALSLEEAEHLRASMHLMGDSWPSGCALALRCLSTLESALDDSLLDERGPVLQTAELRYQLETAEQCLRFANSAADFQDRNLNILLRSLQQTKLGDRLAWWLDVRSCRRRAQLPWEQLPVAKVFVKADEFDDLATKALLSRVRWACAAIKLWPADAFKAMDTDGSGGLDRSELAAGLEWLGVRRMDGGESLRWPQQIDAMFRVLDRDGDGRVDLEEFKAAMEMGEVDWENLAAAQVRDASAAATAATSAVAVGEVAPAGQAPAYGAAAEAPLVAPTLSVPVGPTLTLPLEPGSTSFSGEASLAVGSMSFGASGSGSRPLRSPRARRQTVREIDCCQLTAGRFRLGWQPHSGFRPVWNTAGTLAERPLSLWAPRTPAVKSTARLSLGHLACTTLREPKRASLFEVADAENRTGLFASSRSSVELQQFLDHFFPHPARYHQVWQQVSDRPLYIWEPVPPSEDFVAVGMVSTTGDAEPRPDEVRCVPKVWAERVEERRLVKVWTEVGTGGSPACFWAAVQPQTQKGASLTISEGLFHVTAGPTAHAAPAMFCLPPGSFFSKLPQDG